MKLDDPDLPSSPPGHEDSREPWRLGLRPHGLQVSLHEAWDLDDLDPVDLPAEPRGAEPSATPEQVVSASEPRLEESPRRRLPPRWVIASLGCHLLLMLTLLETERLFPPEPPPPGNLEVYNVNAADLPADLLEQTSSLSDAQMEVKRTPPPLPTGGQIVNLAPPESPQPPPPSARFLASDNQRADRETKARDAKKNPRVLAARASTEERETGKGGDQDEDGGAREERVAMVPRPAPEQEPEPAPKPDEGERTEAGDTMSDNPVAAGSRPVQRKLNLFPSPGQMASMLGAGGPGSSGARRGDRGERAGAPEDQVIDAPEGDETRLNARRFAYNKFVNAVRKQVEYFYSQALDNLGPDDIDRRLFRKQYTTQFTFALGTDGQVGEIRIVQSSGVPALDQLVVKALRNASPLPPPPPELLDSDGQLRILWEYRLGVGLGVPSFDPMARGRRY